MKTLAVTEFKAHALKVLDQIAKTRESVLVTKRGEPLVEVVPYSPEIPRPGSLADALVFEDDIWEPLGDEMWDACK